MAKERALNVFEVLKKIDRGDYGLYDGLNEDSRKELDRFVSYPAIRWMSAAEPDDEHAVCLEMINEIVNPGYFSLGQHKKLQTMLLTAVGGRKWIKHEWIAGPKKSRKDRAYEVLRKAYPHIKDDECDLWMELNGPEELLWIAKSLGFQKEDLKKLSEELKK